MKYFESGTLTEAAFERAEIAAKAILDEALSSYARPHWDTAYGSSGTVGAIADILQAAGWPTGVISREGLDWLQRCLLRVGHANKLRMEGLKEDRRAVIGGGISVLRALFDLLDIDTLHVAQGALRHGVLYDMLEREEAGSDIRSQTVARLLTTFGVDTTQALRVSKVARHLLQQLHPETAAEEFARFQRKLDWAAQLHEIGSQISHSDYHKHGAYILDNADALGFALPELHRLSLLVLGHRGKLRKLEVDFDDESFIKQLLALRLAVILCHARRDPDYKTLQLNLLHKPARVFELSVPADWAKRFPQSAHLLMEEVTAWQKTSWTFQVKP